MLSETRRQKKKRELSQTDQPAAKHMASPNQRRGQQPYGVPNAPTAGIAALPYGISPACYHLLAVSDDTAAVSRVMLELPACGAAPPAP